MSGAAAQSSTSAASTSAEAAEPKLQPTNFANESRSNGSIQGSWIIDTDIEVPAALLAPLPWLQTERPNIFLNTANGSIRADVFLTSGSSKRAFIKVTTSNGSVTLKVVRLFTVRILVPCFSLSDHGINLIYRLHELAINRPRSSPQVVAAPSSSGFRETLSAQSSSRPVGET
jgi:hypothetical protein